jgi:hypothetical protein
MRARAMLVVFAIIAVAYPLSFPLCVHVAKFTCGHTPVQALVVYEPLLLLDPSTGAGCVFSHYCDLCGVPMFLAPSDLE